MKKKKNKFVKKLEVSATAPIQTQPAPETSALNPSPPLPEDLNKFFLLIKNNLTMYLLILAGAFLAYGHLLKADFVNLDDFQGIVINPVIHSLSEAIKLRSVWHLHLAILYQLFGLKAGYFHLSLILSHSINVFLVFLITYVLYGRKISLASTFLFLFHPLASETLGWISGGIYLYNAFFTLSTLLTYILYRKTNNKKYLFVSSGIYLFSILFFTTAWVISTPFIVFAADQFLLEKKITFKNIKHYTPYIILGGLFGAYFLYQNYFSRIVALKEQYYFDPTRPAPVLNRAPYIIYNVIRLLVYPKDLTIYHEGDVITSALYLTMIAVTVASVMLWFILCKKNRTIAGLILLIPVSILPSFSPVAVAWFVAERYLYIATLFFCITLAFTFALLENKYKLKNATLIASMLIISMYAYRTILRSDDFISSKHLWLATMKVSPNSYRVYNNLGDVYAGEGKYELALENFKKSVELFPQYADAVHNMGFTYMQMGDVTNARLSLEKSLEMNPRLYAAAFKLGVLAEQQGNLSEALYYYKKTLEIDPTNAEAERAISRFQQIPQQ